ncbi:MAG: Coenzyme F420 hydrogenase/dehydrogenase, beta subunit C-terminal domain [Candidatus Ranarchaeia archaeon]
MASGKDVKKLGFEELQNKVIQKNLCTGCCACVITCPFRGVLEYNTPNPILGGECKHCGICVRVCPRYNVSVKEIERLTFGRERRIEDVYGVAKTIYVARSTSTDIRSRCQDGGIVTTLLISALTSGIIDGAAISGVRLTNPWFPYPTLVTDEVGIISNAGTRYSYSPNLLAYQVGISKGLKQLAFVGTPCQILALRRIQTIPLQKYAKPLSCTIGLFCSESFSYEGLMLEKIQNELAVNLKDIVKMNIKGGIVVDLKDGETVKIPLKNTKAYAEPKCQYCSDFSGELADISVGGIGLDGWTLTIIRSEVGARIFNNALNHGLIEIQPFKEDALSIKLLMKLSKNKRKKAKRIIG